MIHVALMTNHLVLPGFPRVSAAVCVAPPCPAESEGALELRVTGPFPASKGERVNKRFRARSKAHDA